MGNCTNWAFDRVERPDVAVGRGDDALHLAELAVEVLALGRRERLAGVVEHRDGLGLEAGHPDFVVGVEAPARIRGHRCRRR